MGGCEERDGLGGLEVFELHDNVGCEWGRREWEGVNGEGENGRVWMGRA